MQEEIKRLIEDSVQVNPILSTLNPNPWTLELEPKTLEQEKLEKTMLEAQLRQGVRDMNELQESKPSTLDPKPQTLNPEP